MLNQTIAIIFSAICMLAACTQKPSQTQVPDINFNPPSHVETEANTEDNSSDVVGGDSSTLVMDSSVVDTTAAAKSAMADSLKQDGIQLGTQTPVAGDRTDINSDGGIATGSTGEKEAKTGKETPKPALDLSTIPSWVKEIMSANHAKTQIQRSSKDGMDYFKIDRCVGCSDNMFTVFDENKKTICQIGGITGRDTCQEQGLSFENWEVIYQSARDAKIEKPSGTIFKNK